MISIIRAVIKKIIFIIGLPGKVQKLEYYNFNRRYYAVEQVAAYLVGAKIPGDYLEFGVFRGALFIHAYKWLAPQFKSMRFIAFDSFEGLPEPQGIDNLNHYSSNYHPHEFACSKEQFLKNLKKTKINLRRIKIIKGWFNETLTAKQAKTYGIKRIAAVWIDCDLYESTVPVLKFITPYITCGTVIVFDDWHSFRNDPNRGEQRACRQWLKRNPKIKLAELFTFGYGGIAFTVISCQKI